ncbi:hypothetical protein [Sphingomonas rubra]|uniref:Uncharacterized protein n=1 Tax=Sphingomonas rubra TaxID=634430 RepID=A0A1I5QWG0_9SPHN|nr:hypothetical protein [Sphingomonas rubra]SFP50582.1 hypothetical protein SAMN04488241_102340 [Sphingomonas rubra]
MKTIILLAVAATSVASTAHANVKSVAPKKPQYHATYDAKRDWYCLTDKANPVTTGTRILPRECRSADRWAELGLTVERKR